MEDLDRHYELRLTAEPCRFGVVRRIVQAHLRHWNLTSVTDQTLLGLTELLANVHQHVGPAAPCTLRLHAGPDALTVEISDGSPELPEARRTDPLDSGGRGLAIVAGLCKEWGAQPDGSGKTVWFTVATAPVPTPALLQSVPLALEVDALELEAVLAD
ncbi:ATP-binding protein [Streptacidiphilus rugosus]|uniref:ATP-binding protein n=1 Tax=Streptacidiphilus rugosus TaxID=405783 RepID=UPI00068ED61A|nr:ATP-binding protein [Streptacidiphilus rugosus]